MAALTLDASVVLMAVPLRFAPRLAEVLAELEAGRGIGPTMRTGMFGRSSS